MHAICENYSWMTHPQNISSGTVFLHRRSSHVSCIPQLLLILFKELGDEMLMLQSHSFTGCTSQDAVCWLLTKKIQSHLGRLLAVWEIPHESCLSHLEEIVLHFLVIQFLFNWFHPPVVPLLNPLDDRIRTFLTFSRDVFQYLAQVAEVAPCADVVVLQHLLYLVVGKNLVQRPEVISLLRHLLDHRREVFER